MTGFVFLPAAEQKMLTGRAMDAGQAVYQSVSLSTERIFRSPSFYEFPIIWSPHFLLFDFLITLIGKKKKNHRLVYPHFRRFFQSLPHFNWILTSITSFYE